ncbi:hypothetical protein [Legionella waltersii]|uniref:Uncharacterized protein n=1 Tax=Legionella waltersii TaxID=66969 RepID=A0A0W1A598_9GAMM|nr:hypothetical protein [Legionella waltersii]KTD76440.1 hypothetical protein Lwal_2162 [Legionella waltersii]SNV14462.1 Uncharacterised protein [Legionella waltersii]
MPRTGFFTVESTNRAETKPTHINVGGGQYQALAVALLDYFKRTSRVNDDTLKKILERFYYHFPKFISTQPYLTATERMNMLVNGNRKSEIVECMAYVLQQMMIDEIYANPLRYKEVFADLPPTTTQASLRQPNVGIPVSALEAFTKVTGINLTLSIVEHEKELRKRVTFVGNPNNPHSGIVIQSNQGRYHPSVKSKSDFMYVGQLAISPAKPVEKPCPEGLTISEMVSVIQEDNKRLRQMHNKWQQNLLNMLELNEITYDDLLTMYTNNLPSGQNMAVSPGQTFARIMQSESEVLDVSDSVDQSVKAKSLTSALAQWISLGYVSPDDLFEQVENRPPAKSITA